jgi:hypothetical protein
LVLTYPSGSDYVLLDCGVAYVFDGANAADLCVKLLTYVDDSRPRSCDIDLNLFALQILCLIGTCTRDVYLLFVSLTTHLYVSCPADGDRQPIGFNARRVDVCGSQYLQRLQVLDGQLVGDRLSRLNVGVGFGTDDQATVYDPGFELRNDIFLCLYSQRFAARLLDREVANPSQFDLLETIYVP